MIIHIQSKMEEKSGNTIRPSMALTLAMVVLVGTALAWDDGIVDAQNLIVLAEHIANNPGDANNTQ